MGVQIFGHIGHEKGVGQVSSIACGRDVTVAVIRPLNDPREIEEAYMRSVYADCANADILRQFETYALEYDKYGRGEVLLESKCSICRGSDPCELCELYNQYKDDIAKMPMGIGGRRRRLKSIENFLVEQVKPDLVMKVVPVKIRPTKWEMRKEKWAKRMKKWFSQKQQVRERAVEDLEEDEDPAEIIAKFRMKKDLLNRASSGEAVLDKLPAIASALPAGPTKKSGTVDSSGRIPKAALPTAIQGTVNATNKIRDEIKEHKKGQEATEARKQEVAEAKKDASFGTLS